MKVCIVGTGYVGLTTGACLAFLGHDVTCVDVDPAKIEMLRAGRTPIYEPFMDDLLGDRRRPAALHHRLRRRRARRRCRVHRGRHAVTAPTAAPTCSYVSAAAESIGTHLDADFTVVVNKSTVPIGSGNWVDAIVRDAYERRHGHRAARRVLGRVQPGVPARGRLDLATRSTPTGSSSAPTTRAASTCSTRSTARSSSSRSRRRRSCPGRRT